MPAHRGSQAGEYRYADVDVRPFDAALGAQVRCGDLRHLSDAQFEQIRAAWLDHLVLVFRGQSLTDDDLIALGRRFGEIDDTVRPQPTDQPGQPSRQLALTIVSNVVENGKPIGALSNNMYLALETLPADLRHRIEGLQIKHDATHNSGGFLRKGFDFPSDVSRSPGPSHPAVRTHPETGCDALFLGRRPYSYAHGLALTESESLLDRLWAHASRPELAFYHPWSVGDVVIWDNRCTMHRRNAFDNAARRVMHRTQIKGTRPFASPDADPKTAHPRGMATKVGA
jgi:taurine dioxygenase